MKIKKNNIVPKIISLLLAIFLWIYVMNTENPVETWTIRNVEVKYKNTDYLDKTSKVNMGPNEARVNIKIKGKKNEIHNFKESNLKAYIDFEGYGTGQVRIPVKADLIGQYDTLEVENIYPQDIVFNIESIEENSKELSIITKGDPDDNFIVGNMVSEVNNVKIIGPESYVNKVNKVVAEVDLTSKNSSFSVTSKIYAVDGKNNVLENVKLSPQSVNIHVPIEYTKSVRIEVDLANKLDSIYKISNVRTNPMMIALKSLDNMKNIDKIKTKPLSITESEPSHQEKEAELELPDGVSLIDPNEKVTVTYDIEKIIQKDIETAFRDLNFENLKDNLKISEDALNNTFILKLRGFNSAIEKISPENFQPKVDCSNINASGEYELKLSLPSSYNGKVEILEPKFVRLKIEEKLADDNNKEKEENNKEEKEKNSEEEKIENNH